MEKNFQIDHNNVKASASSFTLTAEEIKKYNGFALSLNADVSFDGGTQAFPLLKGTPIEFPENFTTIETSIAVKLYLGI